MTYEGPLVEALLDDLAGTPGAAALSGTVMPPQLQLVCDALYEQAGAQGRKRIQMADYNDLGRAQGVLTGYIEQALQKHPAQDRKVARDILAALVTSQATPRLAGRECA